ncbi:MAG: hypothetical protein LBQ99_00330 [Endomicrobium sp.]|jgi:hypothetical protein|nr:hypothetical protein [Endomicrobium sp.]
MIFWLQKLPVYHLAVLYGYSDLRHIKQYSPDYVVKAPDDIINIVF